MFLKPRFARQKVSLPPGMTSESNYNILSERMAYYSRYVIRNKCVILGFSMLQLVTSEPEAVDFFFLRPNRRNHYLTHAVHWHILDAGTDLHVPFTFSCPFVCMAFLTMCRSTSLLRTSHTIERHHPSTLEFEHRNHVYLRDLSIKRLFASRPRDSFALTVLIFFPRLRCPIPILALGFSSPLNLGTRFL
jgi:hypothetical protein